MKHEISIENKSYDDIFKNTDTNIHFHFYDQNKTNKHSHDFFEIFLVTEGQILHDYNGKTALLKKGTLCLIKQADVHQILPYNNEKSKHFNIRISVEVFKTLCFAISPTLYEKLLQQSSSQMPLTYKLSSIEFSYFEHLTQKISLSAYPNVFSQKNFIPLASTLAINFLYYLNSATETAPAYPKWFLSFLTKLDNPETLSKPLSEIYSESGYSQTRLNTYFKQYTGTTLIAYITQKKINYACHLLTVTNYSIQEISYLACFNNLNHFNTIFKKLTGVTPTQYRKRS